MMIFMTNKTPSGAKKYRESTEPKVKKQAKCPFSSSSFSSDGLV